MAIEWPRGHTREHIEHNVRSDWMLLPNEPCVLLRRFSPKEDVRRVCAAAYLAELPGKRIGFENHLNVIRGDGQPLTQEGALGLATWLNSAPVDSYLRRRLGSTQVNAVELRELPLPGLAQIQALGRAVGKGASLGEIDTAVSAFFGVAPFAARAA
jgi:adenine-specific DNA-methyltransferase